MKNRLNLIVIAVLLMASITLSSCFGRMYRNSVKNDKMKKQNGTYRKKHYHGRAGGWY
jgi:hypothetical protein